MRTSVNDAATILNDRHHGPRGGVPVDIGGATVHDWYEQALECETPRRGPACSWGEDEEEDTEEGGETEGEDDDVQSDPFDDFDPDDFDDDFDDDFEEEFEDEYEIEPEDETALEDIESPHITIDDGSADADEEDAPADAGEPDEED